MHKSPNDHRDYQKITLDNSLAVLLISDPHASRSAAALSVNVGHFSDPPHRQGLSHFLEHMLFLGTEKYPKVGEFQDFINQHGGSNNAWTGTENTTYFFDIAHPHFANALARFGQFFTSPLFNAEAVDKERNAIESEYRLKIQDDVRRIYQVKKETVNPLHPFSQFSVGSKETLADHDKSQVREELLHFYQSHYSANLMTAALIGPFSLSELEAMAVEAFSLIKNLNLTPDIPLVPFIDEAQKMQFVHIEPLKELRKLSLFFLLEQDKSLYKNKSLSFLAHLLGDEGAGSLLSLLKEKHWATQLSAGGGLQGSNFREFALSMNLTEQGLECIDEVVSEVFAAIALIKAQGISAWRYDEMKVVHESAFHFKELPSPLDTVSHLVLNMQHYEAEDVLYGDFMMQQFDEKEITAIVDKLRVDNMYIHLVAKGGRYNKKAKWYDTPYSVNKFTPKQCEKWSSLDISPSLCLAESNLFISRELAPLPLEEPIASLPVKLEDKAGLRLWHMQESQFYLPKGVIYISIDSPYAISSVTNIVKLHLCVEMLLDVVNELAYPAETAGLNYNIYTHQGGVTLKLSGFSQKQPLLLDLILGKFLQRSFEQKRFENIKTQLSRVWANALKEKPIARLYNKLLSLVQSNNPGYEDLLSAIQTIERDDLPEFVMQLLSCIYVEIFVHGNWHKKQAIEISQQMQQALHVSGQRYQESVRPIWLLKGLGTLYAEKNCDSQDSAVVVYYQSAAKNHQDIANYQFTQHLMSAVFFNELRTKAQLGYMVGSTYRAFNRQPGLIFYVQSPKAGPKILLKAIDDFLNAFFMVLLELSEAEWQASKQGIIAKLTEPDGNLRGKSQRFWSEITSSQADFTQRGQIAMLISNMSRKAMIAFVVDVLKPRKADRLVVHSCS